MTYGESVEAAAIREAVKKRESATAAPAPDRSQVGRAVTLTYMFTAALQDASPIQMAQLNTFPEKLTDPTLSFRDIGVQIFEVMGPGWIPGAEWMEAIDALQSGDEPQPPQ